MKDDNEIVWPQMKTPDVAEHIKLLEQEVEVLWTAWAEERDCYMARMQSFRADAFGALRLIEAYNAGEDPDGIQKATTLLRAASRKWSEAQMDRSDDGPDRGSEHGTSGNAVQRGHGRTPRSGS